VLVQDLWLYQQTRGVTRFRVTNLYAGMQPGHRVTVLSCTVQQHKTHFALYNHTTRRWYARAYRQRLRSLLQNRQNPLLGAIATYILSDFLNLAWLAILVFIWLLVFGYPVWYLLLVALCCFVPLGLYKSYRQMGLNRLSRHAQRLFSRVERMG
jgi:Flp pilus assembly protein TadB